MEGEHLQAMDMNTVCPLCKEPLLPNCNSFATKLKLPFPLPSVSGGKRRKTILKYTKKKRTQRGGKQSGGKQRGATYKKKSRRTHKKRRKQSRGTQKKTNKHRKHKTRKL
jgi:hypothetical protein